MIKIGRGISLKEERLFGEDKTTFVLEELSSDNTLDKVWWIIIFWFSKSKSLMFNAQTSPILRPVYNVK